MKPAIFLDRDGVITIESFRIIHPYEIKIMSFVPSCIQDIHKLGYLAIVITNQSGIDRGLFTLEDLERSNDILKKKTGIDDIFYCPHHPDLSGKCDCRKPSIGLINQAISKYEIDMSKSFMIGDRACDILTGKNAKIKTVLLESGYGKEHLEQNVEADFYFDNLKDFTTFLINFYKEQ